MRKSSHTLLHAHLQSNPDVALPRRFDRLRRCSTAEVRMKAPRWDPGHLRIPVTYFFAAD